MNANNNAMTIVEEVELVSEELVEVGAVSETKQNPFGLTSDGGSAWTYG